MRKHEWGGGATERTLHFVFFIVIWPQIFEVGAQCTNMYTTEGTHARTHTLLKLVTAPGIINMLGRECIFYLSFTTTKLAK
jgi:hypothetical protein